MKEQSRKLVVLALFVLALSGVVLAQDLSPKVRANIPFNFYAGSKMLPAGTYIVAVDGLSHHVAVFQKASGTGAFLLPSQVDDAYSGPSLLTFRNNGEGTYVLEKIEGPDLALSFSTEKALSHIALNRPANDTTVIADVSGK
jgi:hypothetical protein